MAKSPIKVIREFIREIRVGVQMALLIRDSGYRPHADSMGEYLKDINKTADSFDERRRCPECKYYNEPKPLHIVRYTCNECGHEWIAD